MSDAVILATNSPWRGCAASLSQPISSKQQTEAQRLVDTIYRINCNESDSILEKIVYRTGDGDTDIRRQVFRWDLAPHDEVFRNGLQVRRGFFSPDFTFYNLSSYVQDNSGRPMDSRKTSTYAFISTTVSNSWYPPIPSEQNQARTLEVYRYEIYAPGGIWTSATLGSKNDKKFKRLDEVAFAGGIASQYIRSVQVFTLTGYPDGSTTIERADNMLRINGNFNPQSHPQRLLNIENPVIYYTSDKARLVQRIVNKSSTSNPNIITWYATDVAERAVYMSSTFRSSRQDEAYYILQNIVTLLNYNPGGTNDFIVNGPSFISQQFPSLEYSPFGEHGIDAAFQLQGDQAVIFCGNLCALIDYAPDSGEDKILKGPMIITDMFPFFKGTVFENGVDSTCELKTVDYEAYFFKENLCAHVRYSPNDTKLIALGQISQIRPGLKDTVFEAMGVDASYASHAKDEEAYFFKFNNYGQISVDDNGKESLVGVWVMGANAPVIHSFVPQKNGGFDMRDDAGSLPNADDYDHDDV